ncbi:MAG: hypothetical protein QOG43_3528 [Actinomycetota bacterium]|jgi:hypothetical protein|nr:hypothetical protein [Actinomycetota bacterium]
MTIIDIDVPPTPPAEVTDEEPGVATAAPAPSAAADPRWRRVVADLDRPMSLEWGIALVVAWVVVMVVGMAVEPAPANPDAGIPLVIDLMSVVQMSMWWVMAVGIVQRRRFTAAASLAGAGVLAVMAIACPASGHHAMGAWWGVQMVGVVSLLGLSGKALRSSRA